jgi:hypothetical protein
MKAEMKAQVTTTITPSLLINSIKFSGTTEGSLIKLTVPVLDELYLGVITLAKGGPSAPTSGALRQGLPKRPGSADAVISSELYDFLISQANGAPLAIEIEYSKTTIRNIYVEYV